MSIIALEESIAAPADTVFRSVTEIERFPEIQPDVVSVEFVGEKRGGLGTRFIETRRHGKKEMKTDLEVTEWVENERTRMVTDSHGTVWDTLFEVMPDGERTTLRITMDARPHKLLPKIMNPFMQGFFRKGIASYLELLRDHCEGEQRGH